MEARVDPALDPRSGRRAIPYSLGGPFQVSYDYRRGVYLAGCVISGGTSIMITYMRTAVALSGKSLEFVAFAKEMAEIIGRVTGTKPVVATRLGGNANEIAWISHPESLAQLEEIAAKLMADPDYRAGLKKAEHLAVPGMTHDQIWRQV
jgi:hypothetical protein